MSGKLSQKSALAGVGTPIKESLWRVSKLNFPRRYAENAAMTAGAKPMIENPIFSSNAPAICIAKNAGATPNVTMSASESSCLPNSPATPNALAINPSSRSKNAPNKMQRLAHGHSALDSIHLFQVGFEKDWIRPSWHPLL